jgi:hypothetical protein
MNHIDDVYYEIYMMNECTWKSISQKNYDIDNVDPSLQPFINFECIKEWKRTETGWETIIA